MKNTFVRRLGVLVTTGAVAAAGLSIGTTTAAQAAPPASSDPAPAARGTAWLAGELVGGAFLPRSQSSYGLAIDAALSFQEIGQQQASIPAINTDVSNNLDEYWDFSYSFAGDDYYNRAAGAIAKTLVMAQVAGDDPTSYGPDDRNVVTQLEGRAGADGRLVDIAEKNGVQDNAGDCANVLGQSFAARGLAAAGSGEATTVKSYLLSQQKANGSFELGLAGSQCYEALPNNDATSTVILNLQSQKSDPAVKAALDRAVQYLLSQQAADGSFIDSTDGFASGTNANSTGLAGWALGVMGQDAAAAKAASWLRGHQLANAGTCASYAAADNGSVAPNDAAYTAAGPGPLTAGVNATFVRATAQALPALAYSAGGPAAGAITLSAKRFAKPGTTRNVTATGAPGDTVCLTIEGTSTKRVLSAAGGATLPVALPAKGTTTIASVDAGGEADSTAITVLRKKKLKFSLRSSRLEVGDKAVVKVRGLKPGESVKVKLRGKTVDTAKANGTGRKTLRFTVKGKLGQPGAATLKVTGQFGYRNGKQTVRITR